MFILLLQQLVIMFIIMVIGFITYKVKLLDQNANKAFSTFLLMVVTPALIISVFQIDFDSAMAVLLLYAFLAALLSHVVGIFVVNIFVRKRNNPDYGIERLASVYSNCAFMGIPIINATIGSEGVFFLSAYLTVFNLLLWTHGVSSLRGGFSIKNLKGGLFSPVFIATMVAIFFYVAQIRLPILLADSLSAISGTITPLAMMIAGLSIAQADLRNIFLKLSMYKIHFLRLIVIPFLTLGLLWMLNLEPRVAYTILIASACPTATAGIMMAVKYEKNYVYASEIFASGTLYGLLTLPFVVFVAELVL